MGNLRSRVSPIINRLTRKTNDTHETHTSVNDVDYEPPFPLTDKLNKLSIKVYCPELTPEDIKKSENAEAEALDSKPLKNVQPGPR